MNYTAFTQKFLFVSIIVPVRNEIEFIHRSLVAILQQDYPSEMTEIIVADGMSDDGTREYIKEKQEEYPNLHLIDNPQKIVPFALNAAIKISKGEVIIRVDGHCMIARDYVSRCVWHLTNGKVDCVGGPIETIGETYSALVIALAMSSVFGVGGSAFRTVKNRALLVDSVAFPAYTRQVIERVGLFDEELVRNQDDEYNYRLRKLGGKILLTPDIRSIYYSRGSLASLWRQYFQYGFWKVRVLQKHPLQMRIRQFVPALFVMAIIISFLLGLFYPVGWFMLLLNVVSYIMLNLAASTNIAYRNGWHILSLLPIVFSTIHLSYGLGFLKGLVCFVNRWGDRKGCVPEINSVRKHGQKLA